MLTEAILALPVTFDEEKTGVMKNTTKKIVISCKASGRPLPRLEMRLMTKYGPDISKTDFYKVRSNPVTVNNNVSSLPIYFTIYVYIHLIVNIVYAEVSILSKGNLLSDSLLLYTNLSVNRNLPGREIGNI